jgi:hypothetical protein
MTGDREVSSAMGKGLSKAAGYEFTGRQLFF